MDTPRELPEESSSSIANSFPDISWSPMIQALVATPSVQAMTEAIRHRAIGALTILELGCLDRGYQFIAEPGPAITLL